MPINRLLFHANSLCNLLVGERSVWAWQCVCVCVTFICSSNDCQPIFFVCSIVNLVWCACTRPITSLLLPMDVNLCDSVSCYLFFDAALVVVVAE